MRKSVILMIMAVYVLAICAVGFLGLNTRILDPIEYVTEIEVRSLINEETGDDYEAQHIVKDNETYYLVTLNLSEVQGNKLKVNFRVKPEKPTDAGVMITLSETPKASLEKDETADTYYVVINDRGVVTLHLVAHDGKGAKSELRINVKNN